MNDPLLHANHLANELGQVIDNTLASAAICCSLCETEQLPLEIELAVSGAYLALIEAGEALEPIFLWTPQPY